MRFCNNVPHKEWDMGIMDFNHSGWWGWHLIAIIGIFALGYSISKNRNDFNE